MSDKGNTPSLRGISIDLDELEGRRFAGDRTQSLLGRQELHELLRRARQLERVESFLLEHGGNLLVALAVARRDVSPTRPHPEVTRSALAALLTDFGIGGTEGKR